MVLWRCITPPDQQQATDTAEEAQMIDGIRVENRQHLHSSDRNLAGCCRGNMRVACTINANGVGIHGKIRHANNSPAERTAEANPKIFNKE